MPRPGSPVPCTPERREGLRTCYWESVFIPIPKKGNAKECSNYHTIDQGICHLWYLHEGLLARSSRGFRRASVTEPLACARSFPVTGPQPLSSLRRTGNWASRPGHRALARPASRALCQAKRAPRAAFPSGCLAAQTKRWAEGISSCLISPCQPLDQQLSAACYAPVSSLISA